MAENQNMMCRNSSQSYAQPHVACLEGLERQGQLTYLKNHFQVTLPVGIIPWKQAQALRRRMSNATWGSLPDMHVFGGVLGVYFTLATHTWHPVVSFRLADEDIAAHMGVDVSDVAATLAWLGDAPILHEGCAVATGLGYIKRVCPKPWGYETALTQSGHILLGLDDPDTLYWREQLEFDIGANAFSGAVRG